ncbi:MAG: hypothetical protein GYA62_07095 [Bacteroidales bacterium]|nr:hypothetical protein [Bacteroidales bacterium]
MNGLQYFYTKYGDVYAGWKFEEMNFPDYTIVIQGTKLKDYRELKHAEKTLEKISEYGWVLANEVIELIIDSDKVNPSKKNHQSDTWYGDYDRKVMFVFGAGASANCVYGNEKTDFEKDPLRPPLGPTLFDKKFVDYYRRYKGVKQSLHFLQDENPDVEELFEREWKNIHNENNQAVLSRHINIQYYLQEILKDITKRVTDEYFAKNLYAKLTNKLQKIYSASVKNIYGRQSFKKFAFVSFNQDTILETFIEEQFKTSLTTLDDYVNVNDSPFCIFKPHGSWNWGWKFPDISKFNGNTADWLFDNNMNFFQLYYNLLGDHINMIDWSTWGIEASLHKHNLGKFTIDKSQLKIIGNDNFNNYFPALLLPYRDKDEFIMPLRHFYNMEIYLTYVETLVIIGWKGNEDAFNRLLFQKADRINKVIIADPNPDLVEKNLDPILSRPGVTKTIYKNFEDFVENGIDKEII